MSKNVVDLGRVTNKSSVSNVGLMLEEAKEAHSERSYPQALLVFVDPAQNSHELRRMVSGMSNMEILATLELLKQITLQDMGYAN